MTDDEIIEMAVKCYLISTGNREGFYGDALIQFAKLVEEKAIKEALAQPEQIQPSAYSNTHQPERHELQAKGEHPAPCARHCEANAFKIVIRNLKAQLAQPEQEFVCSTGLCYYKAEQEPVAWMDADGNVSDNNDHKCFPIPLYTHPPQRTWVDVPDEEIKRLWIQYRAALPRYLCFAKDLLSIAKEKNT